MSISQDRCLEGNGGHLSRARVLRTNRSKGPAVKAATSPEELLLASQLACSWVPTLDTFFLLFSSFILGTAKSS